MIYRANFFWITCLIDQADYSPKLNIAFAYNKLAFK